MAKVKEKPATAFDDGPTPERLARHDFDTMPAPRLSDDDWRNRNGKARKVSCRIARMRRDGWIAADGERALLAYQGIIEMAGYDRSRSCLDFSPKGGGSGLPPAVVTARMRLRDLDPLLIDALAINGYTLVRTILGPFGTETVGDASERALPAASRDTRRTWSQDVFAAAAMVLIQEGL